MPGLYDADLARPMPDIGDKLWNIDADGMPCLDMMKEGQALINTLSDWEMESTERRAREGRKDGEPVTEFTHIPQVKAEAYAGHQLEPWKVTKIAALKSTAGIKDQKSHQSMKALSQLFLAMERMALSDQEMQNGTSVDDYLFRGIFKWLQSAAQTVKPVDANYRLSSDAEYTGSLASLDADTFEGLLEAAWLQTNGAMLQLDGFVGSALKRKMNDWGQLVASGAATEQRTISQESKKYMRMIDEFAFDTAIVRAHLSANLLVDASGALTASSTKSGAFMNMDAWEKRFLQKPQRFELPPDGGNYSGYADVIWMPQCNNPKGQVVVNTATA